jgi:sigma-B regulation protein RsbU (phosphoserine phosphatase)
MTGPATLLIRRIVLVTFTVIVTGFTIASIYMVAQWVHYIELHPGYWVERIDMYGRWWNVYWIRESGGYLRVYRVDPGSAAEKAGIQPGDSVVAVDGARLKDASWAFFRPFIGAKPGKQIELELMRKGALERRTVILEKNDYLRTPEGYLGVQADTLSAAASDSLGLTGKYAVRVTGVLPGDPAERAGIKAGDILFGINGGKFSFARIKKQSGGSKIRVDLLRDGTHMSIETTLEGRDRLRWSYGKYVVTGSALLMAWVGYLSGILLVIPFLVVGAFIGFSRPRDDIAFQLSILFLAFVVPILGSWAEVPLQDAWPDWALTAFVSVMVVSVCLSTLILRVFSVFPNPSRLGKLFLKWQWVVFVIFGVFGALTLIEFFTVLYDWKPGPWITHPVAQAIINTEDKISIGFVALLGSLLIAQRIETRKSPGARLRIVELGFLTGLIGIVIETFRGQVLSLIPSTWEPRPIFVVMTLLTSGLLAAMPVSVAYAAVKRKVFGIQFIVRKGLQHLLLSRAALVFEGLIVFFIVQQTLQHGGARIAASMTAVSGLAVGCAAVVIAGVGRINRKVMPAIDRRFFKEACDVRRVLSDLGERLSEMREEDKILRRTSATVMKTLHPSRVVVFLKKGDVLGSALTLENGHSRGVPLEQLEATARASADLTLRPQDTAVQSLEQGKPSVDVYPERLDPGIEEEKRLIDCRSELLIPMRGSAGLMGVMALGPKLSEEAYSPDDKELLITVSRQMALSLEVAELLEVAKREAQMSRDIEIARSVQQNLFPKLLPSAPGWELVGMCRPAKAVGGDYYDVFEVSPGKVLLALGDVSGKGIGASLLMASVHSAIRSRAGVAAHDIAQLAADVNRQIAASTSVESFVTLFIGVLDLETGSLDFVNCGHPSPLVFRNGLDGPVDKLDLGGPVVGIVESMAFSAGRIEFTVGDVLVVYSDGVTEAFNGDNEMYEDDKLVETVRPLAAGGESASGVMNAVLESVESFAAGAEQSDDISVLVVKRTGFANSACLSPDVD